MSYNTGGITIALDKKTLITLLLIILIPTVLGQEEFIVGEGDLTPEEIEQLDKLQQAQLSIQQLSQLSTKIDQLGAASVENLEVMAIFFNTQITELRLTIIVTVIITALSMLGIWWAIFLYFQSRSLILFGNKKEKKPKKKRVV